MALTNALTWLIVALAACLVPLFAFQEISRARARAKKARTNRCLSAILDGTWGDRRPLRENKRHLRGYRSWKPILDSWIALSGSIVPDEDEIARARLFFSERNADLLFIRRLRIRSAFQRCRSAYYLGFLDTERSGKALALALRQEPSEVVKLYLIGALARLGNGSALPDIVDSLKGCSEAFIRRITGLLIGFQSSFIAYFPHLETRHEREIVTLILEFARIAPYQLFEGYLRGIALAESAPRDARVRAFACLMESYPLTLDPADYLDSPDAETRRIAYASLGSKTDRVSAHILLNRATGAVPTKESGDREIALTELTRMARQTSEIFVYLVSLLRADPDAETESALCQAASCRLDWFLLKTGNGEASLGESVVAKALESGKASDLISFLNDNHDADIENRLVAIILRHAAAGAESLDALRMYLKPTTLQKVGLSPLPLPQKRLKESLESVRRGPLFTILAAVGALFPALATVAWIASPGAGLLSAIRSGLDATLAAFAWYAFALNTFYLFLACNAWAEADRQNAFHSIKDESFLFSPNMLPSISILAPAYNEASSIVQSVESLLASHYPEFEVIVVNDGSKDDTLSLLIARFDLERTDITGEGKLQTQPIRGVYANPRIPSLKVIDKINGGKADSLNVGINFASGEYVLGIDSDSLLERDSLLTLVSAFLDSEIPVVASGGNILPVNGCEVDGGTIVAERIPKNPIALAQTVEYLRAFATGRLGWSRIGSLMIISGAFGIFRREEVLAINGYLTGSEKFEKDTVGEDMELVILLTRDLRERRVPHRMLYNSLANCWTEVPSRLKILKRQRDRWQRGLIDILSFHRRMIGNPLYGAHGIIGFPYYAIFEVIGPWFELLGTLALVASLAFGWQSASTLGFLLASNFLYGFALSLLSLCISGRGKPPFTAAGRIGLAAVSVIETLGIRQIISFFRLTGFVGVLRKKTGWGSMARSGFQGKRRKA
ncbi:MAG TPA: glycosyltransferase family 2 protein [Treponemataceae bacterium]|nr:glycosyltransferase family 2 protein [Treponemataceae bacterium]